MGWTTGKPAGNLSCQRKKRGLPVIFLKRQFLEKSCRFVENVTVTFVAHDAWEDESLAQRATNSSDEEAWARPQGSGDMESEDMRAGGKIESLEDDGIWTFCNMTNLNTNGSSSKQMEPWGVFHGEVTRDIQGMTLWPHGQEMVAEGCGEWIGQSYRFRRKKQERKLSEWTAATQSCQACWFGTCGYVKNSAIGKAEVNSLPQR